MRSRRAFYAIIFFQTSPSFSMCAIVPLANMTLPEPRGSEVVNKFVEEEVDGKQYEGFA
jgi:hypothetical protein